MLIKEFIENRDNYDWFRLYSDIKGKAILQVETGDIYGEVAMREDDPHTYEEADDPNYNPEEDIEVENNEIANIDTSV